MYRHNVARREHQQLSLTLLFACTALCGGAHSARANFIWAVGDAGTILHSTNSGSTWRTQASGTTQGLRAVDFVDFGYGWAVGNGGTIRHTQNGGATWTTQASGTAQTIHAVDFVDRNRGWAVDNTGGVLRTTNGGATWTRTQAYNFGALRAVDFQSSSTGWAAGAPYPLGAVAINTTDGGANWDFYDVESAFATITGLDFSDSSSGWAIANGNRMYRTTNGGNAWSVQQLSFSGSPAVINNLDFVEGFTAGVGVGANASWRTTNGATWTRTPIASTTLNDVSMLTTNNGWAVGNGGVRLRTTNGGSGWTTQTDALTTANLHGVATIFTPGQSQNDSFMPTGPSDPDTGSKPFDDVPGDGLWFDPPLAGGYDFATDGNSNFTLVGLPDSSTVPDADSSYKVVSSLGTVTVSSGQTYTFPTPVAEFRITGIDPAVDGDDPNAFPVFLQFNQHSVSFTMTPVSAIPEPSSSLLVAVGFALLAIGASGRRRKASL